MATPNQRPAYPPPPTPAARASCYTVAGGSNAHIALAEALFEYERGLNVQLEDLPEELSTIERQIKSHEVPDYSTVGGLLKGIRETNHTDFDQLLAVAGRNEGGDTESAALQSIVSDTKGTTLGWRIQPGRDTSKSLHVLLIDHCPSSFNRVGTLSSKPLNTRRRTSFAPLLEAYKEWYNTDHSLEESNYLGSDDEYKAARDELFDGIQVLKNQYGMSWNWKKRPKLAQWITKERSQSGEGLAPEDVLKDVHLLGEKHFRHMYALQRYLDGTSVRGWATQKKAGLSTTPTSSPSTAA